MDQQPTESLLADLQWLQELARALVRDPEAAADAVQETCVLALRHDGVVAHRRAWLATILRNCLSLRGRSERRVQQRQQWAARSEASAGTEELVQRAELQQRLVGAVLQLPPQHRDVVLLRFFDGLPPRAIAAHLDVPVATIHSRLQRALQQLRGLLDVGCGGRRAWSALALGLPLTQPWFWPVLGVLMQAKLKVAVGVVLAAGTATWWCTGESASPGVMALPAEPIGRAPERGGSGDGDGSGAASDRGRTAVPANAVATIVSAEAARIAVRGRVCGCDGRAIAGVPVTARGEGAERAVSDSTGMFAIDLRAQPTSLTVLDRRFVSVLDAQWTPDARVEPVLVVAPAVTVAGRVVDSRGAMVARAQVVVELPTDFDARFPVPLDRGERLRFHAVTGSDGAFDLGRIPCIDGATLLASADALRPASVPMPTGDDHNLEIRLSPFAYEQGQIDGIVVDPQGAPVAGARVAMGVTSVVSDNDGHFALLLRRAGWPSAIVAAKQGFLPGRCELPRGGGAQRTDWPDRVVLRLGTSPLSISGHVVDQNDKPVVGAMVWVADPTLLGIAGVLPVQTEYLLAGGSLPRGAARMPTQFADEPTQDGMFLTQSSNTTQPSSCWFFVTTDENGRFELPGLLPRDYRLRAFDTTSGIVSEVGPVPAGGVAELVIARTGLWPEVKGQVVSIRGEPLAGVEVEHHVKLFVTDERVPGGRFAGSATRTVQRVSTAADGTFALRDVNPQHSTIGFGGDAILPRTLAAKDIADPRLVVADVEARCHVEVVLLDPGEADEIAAQAANGDEIEISVLRAGSTQMTTNLALHDGKSGVFVLGERTAFLLLLRSGEMVRKVALQLQPGVTFRVQ